MKDLRVLDAVMSIVAIIQVERVRAAVHELKNGEASKGEFWIGMNGMHSEHCIR